MKIITIIHIGRLILITLLFSILTFSCQKEYPKIELESLQFTCDYKLDDPTIGDGYISGVCCLHWPTSEDETSEKLRKWIKEQMITIQPEDDSNKTSSKDNKSCVKIKDTFDGSDIKDLYLERMNYIKSTVSKNNPITKVSIYINRLSVKDNCSTLEFLCVETFANNKQLRLKAISDILFDSSSILNLSETEELHSEDYTYLFKYQPRLREYNYKFDKDLITRSSDLSNGDWESNDFYGDANVILNKLAPAQFDGIDVGDRYGFSSAIYDSYFRNQTADKKENNQSVRVNIFRHPDTGQPMLAVNGRLVNCDRLNVYPHENGYGVEMSFRALKEHPIIDLEGDDEDYPSKFNRYLFLKSTTKPYLWNEPNEEKLFFAKRRVQEAKEEYGETSNYYDAVRKMELVDTAYNADKYFFVNVTIHNPQKNPSMSLNFDNRRFALTCTNNRRKLEEGELTNDELKKVEEYGFGEYEHTVVANNTHIDPTNIGGSVAASNLGLYGKSVAGVQQVVVGRDIYYDGDFYGRIFETEPTSTTYKFHLFRRVEPTDIEILEIPRQNNYEGKAILWTRRGACHFKRPK